MAIDLRGRSSVSFHDTFAEFPIIGSDIVLYVDRDTLTMYIWNGSTYEPFSGGGSGSTITVVANYAALPDPTTVSGQFYWCSASQGTYWLPGSLGGNYRPSGLYYSNGTSWEYTPTPYNASQSVVNTGTNDDQFITPKTFNNSAQLASKFPNPIGTTSQYIRGDGSLANFPTSTGGGASLSFYLNGSVSQGTFGGISFREMDRTPILGVGTDFTINADGYIQSFITDAGVPNLLEIPAGNWNFETYFSASSGGGSPSFYVELYKWDGSTLTLIASSSANPEGITNGTVTDLYVSALAVPQTTLLATDRLAVRIYVNHSSKTIKLHTENGNLCQVITTFSTGLTALNGLTTQVQNLAVGTSGTDFAISSVASTHTFNLPTASATNRGALSSADWSVFNGKLSATVTSPTGGDTLQYNATTAIWENSKPFWTIDLMDNSSVEFYAVQDVKINSITNIVGSPSITIADDGTPYTLTNTILSGSKITVTSNIQSVFKLNITY
jgi:hypothetical protein